MRNSALTAARAAALGALTFALAAALPQAAAADAALVLGNADYANLPDLPRGAEVTEAIEGLGALGFNRSVSANGGWQDLQPVLADFMANMAQSERLVVALSGRFVTDGSRTWYLTADASPPTLFAMGRTALSVESLLLVLARYPSRAVLLLGVDPEGEAVFDPWLREGVGELDIPQGVTVLTGAPRDAARFLAGELSAPQGDLQRLVAANAAIRPEGYLPQGFVLMPALREPEPGPETGPGPDPRPEADLAAEAALWQGAVALDTVDAYRNYVAAYPQGRYVAQAQQGIAAILGDPDRRARLAEEGLGLGREARQAVQRDLALLDFDPRGIDGVFGPGTRAALTNWQQQNGFAQTGYLDAEQVARLEAQAARRQAQAEAEAERAREAAAAADRAFWEESGEGRDEAGLRAYLERYPEGQYAAAAAERLGAIEGERRSQAEAADRAAWDEAREANTVRAYRAYMEAFPQGLFFEDARERRAARVAAQQADEASEEDSEDAGGRQAAEAARAAEEALGLNALTARVIEQRLDALGLDAGEVDGEFDRATRDALREFQRDRDLPVSGFLNEPTLVRLLADTLGEALRE